MLAVDLHWLACPTCVALKKKVQLVEFYLGTDQEWRRVVQSAAVAHYFQLKYHTAHYFQFLQNFSVVG